MHRIVVLGGGTGGTLAANRLRRAYTETEASITVVDQDDRHVYQPGLLFVPFGLAHAEDMVRPRGHQLHQGSSTSSIRSTASTSKSAASTSATARNFPTTCWSSRPAPCWRPRRPRA